MSMSVPWAGCVFSFPCSWRQEFIKIPYQDNPDHGLTYPSREPTLSITMCGKLPVVSFSDVQNARVTFLDPVSGLVILVAAPRVTVSFLYISAMC